MSDNRALTRRAEPKRTIGGEITSTFLIVSVIPLVLGALVLGWLALSVQAQDEAEKEELLATQGAALLAGRITRMTDEISSVAQVRQYQDLPRGEQQGALSELLAFVPSLERVSVVNGRGSEVTAVSSNEVLTDSDLDEVETLPVYREAMRTGQSAWALDSTSARVPALLLAVPILDAGTGKPAAVVLGRSDLQPLRELLQVTTQGTGQNAFIVNSAGEIVLHDTYGTVQTTNVPDSALETGLHRNRDGSWVVAGTAPFGQSTLVVEEDALSTLSTSLLSIGAIAALALLAMALGIWQRARLSRRIVTPIERLAETADVLGRGEMSARAQPADTRELDVLAATFNEMAQSQQEDRRRLEATNRELELSNQNLQQFATVASHDLQEPLRTIITYLDLIEVDYDLPDGMSEDFAVVSASARRMRALIADLLTYSRLGAASEPEQFDTEALVRETVEDLAPVIRMTETAVIIGRLPPARGVASRVRRVFQNLLDNAIKYRAPERPLVIEVSGYDRGDGWVEYEVTDNGQGIAGSQHENAFRVFGRIDRKTEGTGIGLAICRRVVESCGGQIQIISPPQGAEHGTTFRFTLPSATGRDDE